MMSTHGASLFLCDEISVTLTASISKLLFPSEDVVNAIKAWYESTMKQFVIMI